MSERIEIPHTYTFLKAGAANRYLAHAEEWGGFFIGFEGFPLECLDLTFEEAASRTPRLKETIKPIYFKALQDIYRISLDPWRAKVRIAVWDRENCRLEIWQPSGCLRPFPREHLLKLFNTCEVESQLPHSVEWRKFIADNEKAIGSDALSEQCDFACGTSGYRFLPARRLCVPLKSELLYTPIDTLSVLRQLNQRTFAYMTSINPPGEDWPSGVFKGQTVYSGPEGSPQVETGYGRFVREYLDRIVDPEAQNSLATLTREQRILLVCATLNPILVETAAMLFALDIGMVVDSGYGKGRHGIDVIAACGRSSSPVRVIARLAELEILLPKAAEEHLLKNGTLSFQCKGFDGPSAQGPARVVEFRRFQRNTGFERGISISRVLALARDPERSGLKHLHAWLERMCDVVVPGLEGAMVARA